MCVGGDLHYHLSQHGVFSEKEMRFYAAEIILGLEHMHNRFVVYRDLKVGLSIIPPLYHPPFIIFSVYRGLSPSVCLCVLCSTDSRGLSIQESRVDIDDVPNQRARWKNC